ncbi:MAG: hypothetical protein ACKVY0_19155 [Prosthecobacter sp.]|uniref:hypothetical protein n=1 Tax=Prosthecobacter sp. TaxID=1965333 RepID=UPI0039035038
MKNSLQPMLLLGLLSLAWPYHVEAEPPPTLQLVGTTQIDRAFTAYLRENGGSGHVFTLSEGETAGGWRITETTRDTHGQIIRIHLQRGDAGLWLSISGGSSAAAPVTAEKTDTQPLIDIPDSKRGPLHDQVLHRARIKHKPQARAAHCQISDLDPFPAKPSR